MIEKLPIMHLKVYMKSECKIELPFWLSSTIRGAIGTELIKYLCCMEKKAECESCNDLFNCSVKILYHTGSQNKSDVIINPYIIHCENGLVNGSEICFDIILFGEGIKTYTDIFRVLSRGLKLGVIRESFKLIKIDNVLKNQSVFDGAMWVKPESSFLEKTPENISVDKIKVKFLSMYNAKQKNIEAFDFDYFIRGCMRRVSAVLNQSNISMDVNFKKLLESAKDVKTVEKKLNYTTLKRFSNRTGTKQEIQGIEGSITFEGNITPFLEFLKLSEVIGVGKLCVMGLGKIQVEYL